MLYQILQFSREPQTMGIPGFSSALDDFRGCCRDWELGAVPLGSLLDVSPKQCSGSHGLSIFSPRPVLRWDRGGGKTCGVRPIALKSFLGSFFFFFKLGHEIIPLKMAPLPASLFGYFTIHFIYAVRYEPGGSFYDLASFCHLYLKPSWHFIYGFHK